jgi:hypothetical protein
VTIEKEIDIKEQALTESQLEIYISWKKRKANTLSFNYPQYIGARSLYIKTRDDVLLGF